MPPEPAINPGEVALATAEAVRRLVVERGVDARFGRRLPYRLERHGLADVGAEAAATVWRGGTPGARLMRANFEQLRDDLVASGAVTDEEFASDLARLDEPDFAAPSPVMWAVWGRRAK
jgi:hypothetical protein